MPSNSRVVRILKIRRYRKLTIFVGLARPGVPRALETTDKLPLVASFYLPDQDRNLAVMSTVKSVPALLVPELLSSHCINTHHKRMLDESFPWDVVCN